MPDAATHLPLVSVVMPVYNGARHVADTIRSILAQTYSHFEFVIADDGSTDGSADVVRAFAAGDARIRPLFLEHAGRQHTTNTAVAYARGAFVAFIDHDDLALPERLSIQLAWMQRTGVDVCGSCAKRFEAGEQLLWFPETHEALRHELLFRCALLRPSVMMRADVARAHPCNPQVSFDDYELWLRLAPRYRLGNVPQVLLTYRTHPRQTHIVEAEAFRDDQHRLRRAYFHTLFPEATAADYAALAGAIDAQPFETLDALERAGAWLVRLAQTPDRFQRTRMANRWRAVCRRSTHLGRGCYRCYRAFAPRFGVGTGPDDRRLQLGCAVRLRAGSPLEHALRKMSRLVKSRHTSP